MIGMVMWLGRTQLSGRDYFLGGNRMSYWAIGISTMATQCSTNSLLGAPAFVMALVERQRMSDHAGKKNA